MCTLLLFCTLRAGLIIVASDGSGDASNIQSGINIAAVGDTVLISPGVWSGAVVIDNKPITIGSYYIVDGDSTHISQTIIDGEDTRTGIIIKNCDATTDTLSVVGLTIRNCRSNYYPLTDVYSNGGGIGVMFSVAEISKCVIHHCRAYFGGGISVILSSIRIIGNAIYKNVAQYSGGGISAIMEGTEVDFDNIDLNSIYLNSAATGNDISYAVSCNPTTIYLDQGSVSTSDPYFYYCPAHPQIFINRGMINQVSYDLWVSPDGDNSNNGATPQTPLKNISYALAKIQPSGNIACTVNVMPGVYSWSQTGEALPLQPKSYVNVIGEGINSVLIDSEQYSTFIVGIRAQDYMTIKNLTLINGYSKINNLFWLIDGLNDITHQITVENICIKNSWVKFDALQIKSCRNLTVNNLIIEDSQVGNGFNIYAYETGNFSNFRVQRLTSTNTDMYNSSCTGGGISKPLSAAALHTTINISNFLITDIVDTSQFWQNMPSGLSIGVEGGNCDLNINNCTIANNSSVTQSGGLNITLENCNMQVNNTIVSGNTPYEVAMFAFGESTFADVSFNNCLVSGGSDSFFILGGDITHTWVGGNLFGYPSFMGGAANDPLYYSLASNSPCIDSGTPDTTGLDLPPFDLVGNWRIWNNIIDMGCYEYGSEPWVSNDDPVVPEIPAIKLVAYPNPFQTTTTIKMSFSVEFVDRMTGKNASLDIYNLKGQKVKEIYLDLRNSLEHVTAWDGRDYNGNYCSSGLYFLNLTIGGKQVLNRKITLIK